MRHHFLIIQTSYTSLIEERISQTASLGLEDQPSLSNPEAPEPLDDLETEIVKLLKENREAPVPVTSLPRLYREKIR